MHADDDVIAAMSCRSCVPAGPGRAEVHLAGVQAGGGSVVHVVGQPRGAERRPRQHRCQR